MAQAYMYLINLYSSSVHSTVTAEDQAMFLSTQRTVSTVQDVALGPLQVPSCMTVQAYAHHALLGALEATLTTNDTLAARYAQDVQTSLDSFTVTELRLYLAPASEVSFASVLHNSKLEVRANCCAVSVSCYKCNMMRA